MSYIFLQFCLLRKVYLDYCFINKVVLCNWWHQTLPHGFKSTKCLTPRWLFARHILHRPVVENPFTCPGTYGDGHKCAGGRIWGSCEISSVTWIARKIKVLIKCKKTYKNLSSRNEDLNVIFYVFHSGGKIQWRWRNTMSLLAITGPGRSLKPKKSSSASQFLFDSAETVACFLLIF